MKTLTVLGGGLSSVAGRDWFLIGYGGNEVFVAISDHSTDEIEVKTFTPGQQQLGDGPSATGECVDEIKRFCRILTPSQGLNWDDTAKASGLYWSYKKGGQ